MAKGSRTVDDGNDGRGDGSDGSNVGNGHGGSGSVGGRAQTEFMATIRDGMVPKTNSFCFV